MLSYTLPGPTGLAALLTLSGLSPRAANSTSPCPFLRLRWTPPHKGLEGVYRATPAQCFGEPVWVESAQAYAAGARRRLRALHVTNGAAIDTLFTTVVADTPVRCNSDPFGAHAMAWGRVSRLSQLNGTLFSIGTRRIGRPGAHRARAVAVCERDDAVRLPRRDGK